VKRLLDSPISGFGALRRSVASSLRGMNMKSPKERAAEYRRKATECLEIAAQMSLRADGAQMREMAERWTELAETLEGRSTNRSR
jgi:hypothetical protein